MRIFFEQVFCIPLAKEKLAMRKPPAAKTHEGVWTYGDAHDEWGIVYGDADQLKLETLASIGWTKEEMAVFDSDETPIFSFG